MILYNHKEENLMKKKGYVEIKGMNQCRHCGHIYHDTEIEKGAILVKRQGKFEKETIECCPNCKRERLAEVESRPLKLWEKGYEI